MMILIAGISVRHIASSAVKAGFSVIAADCYCDLDLERCASQTILLPEEDVVQNLQEHIDRFSPDAVILGPGIEEARVKNARVLNNPPEKIAQVSDKLWLAQWLESKGFPHIKTQTSADGIVFPAIVKPRKSAGGVGCELVKNKNDLLPGGGVIIQEFVEGLPASVSTIGNGHVGRAIAVNEQLIGAGWTGARGFRYSGNITPLAAPSQGITEIAEDITSELGLVGSNGIDFLLTEKGPVVVEVNPRFQGSIDTVELSTGINVFCAHLESFDGILPEYPNPEKVAGRAIIYAEDELRIDGDLSSAWITDIPRIGSIIKKEDPVASILAIGRDREHTVNMLIKRAQRLRKNLKAFSRASMQGSFCDNGANSY
ncbi:MAG: ATP-grasp domain-containing protein [Methanotrichaceae archaeon]